MLDFNDIITQIPINAYAVVGCLIIGYVMKKWLPTDNKIIPTVLPILGAVIVAITEGVTVPFIIGGALSGSVAVGLNQVFKQYIEGKDLAMTNGEGEQAEDVETEVVEDESEGKEGEK